MTNESSHPRLARTKAVAADFLGHDDLDFRTRLEECGPVGLQDACPRLVDPPGLGRVLGLDTELEAHVLGGEAKVEPCADLT